MIVKLPITRRRAFSLLELIVVIAIISILLALLLAAISKVRFAAMRVEATNGIRQFLIASHHYANAKSSHFPDLKINLDSSGNSAIPALLPFLETTIEFPPTWIRFKTDPSLVDSIAYANNPNTHWQGLLDPKLEFTSLALNSLAYSKTMTFPGSFTDGTSSTIVVTEHYGHCNGGEFRWQAGNNTCFELPDFRQVPCGSYSSRRPSFADAIMHKDDVMPVTTNAANGVVTRGSLPLTFQVQPTRAQCDPRIPQSSFSGGILSGFADASVRFIRPDIGETIFWSSVTPNRGEVVSLD